MTGRQALTVLVVEDEKSGRLLLRALLEEQGHRAVLAEDGAQAVELFRQHAPDLVLMDVIMPVMDGHEATRRIKALAGERWVPVVFLSQLAREADLVAGLEAGADDYLFKPISGAVLGAKLRALQRALALQRAAEESRRGLEIVSDSLVDALIITDERATIRTVNPAVTWMLGYEPEELVGRNVTVLMSEPERSAHDGHVRRYVDGGPPHIIGMGGREVTCLRKDGSRFDAEVGVTEARRDGHRLFVGLIRDITERKQAERQLAEYAQRLRAYRDEAEAENRLAREIMERQAYGQRLHEADARYWVAPARHFSGDVVSAQRDTDGRLYLMLADATGHGLAAAMCVMQALVLFNQMAGAGLPLEEIVRGMNAQFREVMPVGRFVAATLWAIDQGRGAGEVWVGGMPDTLLVDEAGQAVRRFPSRNLPLGIAGDETPYWHTEPFEWRADGQLVCCSDGLLEAENAAGEAFGEARFLSALGAAEPQARLRAVRQAVDAHLAGAAPHDDLSLAIVSLRPGKALS